MRAGTLKRLFVRFDGVLRERGYLPMGGQIVDATIIEARRPRLTELKKETIKGGEVPAEWKSARRAQIDRDGIVNLSGRGVLLVSVARQLGSGNFLARLWCCPAQAERGRKKVPSVR